MRRSALMFGAIATAVALAGCGSSSKSSGGSGSGDAQTVKVQIKPSGCAPETLTLEPGPKNFEVTNDGADTISEYEIKNGERIIGEAENLAPGLVGKFSINIKPGAYTTVCPGGKSGTLTVSGTPESTVPASNTRAAVATASYKTYVAAQTAELIKQTKTFTDAVKAGDVPAAKAAFAAARAPYERIEPVAESFGDLDPRIDAREGDVPANEWGGFHRIEKQLWVNGNTTGMTPVADQLTKDVAELNGKVANLDVDPAQIANGAVELLNEVGKSKITGEEDRYSHTDLSDFEANVVGARETMSVLLPIITAANPSLSNVLNRKFLDVTNALAAYQKGDGYVSYTTLTKDDTKALATKVDALADELAQVPPLVVKS